MMRPVCTCCLLLISTGVHAEPVQAVGAVPLHRFRLEAHIDTNAHRLSGEATFVIAPPTGRAHSMTFLLNRDLRVLSVKDGRRVIEVKPGAMKNESREFTLELAADSGAQREVHVAYEGVVNPPGPKDPDWMGVLLIRPDEIRMTSQTVWCPTIPGVRAPFEATLKLPSSLTLVCPGVLSKTSDDGREATWQIRCDQPVTPAFIAGKYVTRSVELGPKRKLQVCVCPDQADRIEVILSEIHPIIKFFESQFGRYPYADTLTVAQMHVLNQNFSYNYSCPSYLVLPDEIVRAAAANPALFRPKLAHELAHQWWGNCVEFTDMSWLISESLAELSAALYLQHAEPDKPLGDILTEAAERARLINYRARKGDQISARDLRKVASYGKGPWALALVREMQGPSRFDENLRRLFRKKTFGRVDRAEFIRYFDAPGGAPVGEVLDQWVSRPEIPELSATVLKTDPQQAYWQLEIAQAGPVFRLPLEVELRYGQRHTRLDVTLTEARSRHRLEATSKPDAVVLDPRRKLLFDSPTGGNRLALLLPEIKAARVALQKALQEKDWPAVDAIANHQLCEAFRELQYATDPRLDEVSRQTDLRIEMQYRLEQHKRLRSEVEARFTSPDARAALGRIVRILAEAADDIHDSIRDGKLKELPTHVAALQENWPRFWDLLSDTPASQESP